MMHGLEPLWASSLGISPPAARLLQAGLLLAACVYLLLPAGRPAGPWRRLLAIVSGVAGLVGLWTVIPALSSPSAQAAFWSISVLTLGAAVATISAHSPVYSAIWFAVSLLGTAALLLLQGAQFLGIATVAVYAGAIVVTFLFVLMLAQPEGHTFYDRVSWGRLPRVLATAAAIGLAVIVAATLADADSEQRLALQRVEELVRTQLRAIGGDAVQLRSVRIWENSAGQMRIRLAVAASDESRQRVEQQLEPLMAAIAGALSLPVPEALTLELEPDQVRAPHHVAGLGAQLFTRHLIAVDVAAALLLVALVGAIAMVSRDADGVDRSPRAKA